MSGQQKNEWAVVLGASSGFGEACAIGLSELGFNIIGIHLDRLSTMPNVERIIRTIKSNGCDAIFFNHNAADESKRKDILDDLEKRPDGKPSVKVLIHSLAFGTLKPFVKTGDNTPLTQAQMEMTMDVMAHSLVYWTQDLFHRGFLVPKARVFAMTSSGSRTSIPFYGAVSAAKAALESHVRQLSCELGTHDISVNAILAGVTDTPAFRKIPGSIEMIEVAQRKNPHGRLTTPLDVAKVVKLLMQEGGEWISGSVIHADGGEDSSQYVGQNFFKQV